MKGQFHRSLPWCPWEYTNTMAKRKENIAKENKVIAPLNNQTTLNYLFVSTTQNIEQFRNEKEAAPLFISSQNQSQQPIQ